jgi:hypothetical protein
MSPLPGPALLSTINLCGATAPRRGAGPVTPGPVTPANVLRFGPSPDPGLKDFGPGKANPR